MKKDTGILNLNLARKWFDMIESGEKTEEYREIKAHWISRLAIEAEFGLHDFATLAEDGSGTWDSIEQNGGYQVWAIYMPKDGFIVGFARFMHEVQGFIAGHPGIDLDWEIAPEKLEGVKE
jgi:hypothetical protein